MRQRFRPRGPLTCAAVALVSLALAGPAVATTTEVSTAAAAAEVVPIGAVEDGAATTDDHAERPTPADPGAVAAELTRQLAEETAALGESEATLDQLATAASKALEAQQLAERASLLARDELDKQNLRLEIAKAKQARARADLRAYAGNLYRGRVLESQFAMSIVGGQDPADYLHGVGVAGQVGAVKSNAVNALRRAEDEQAAATTAAAEAAAEAAAAEAVAEQARQQAAELVAEQAARVAEQAAAVEATRTAAEQAAAAADDPAAAAALAGSAVTLPEGACAGLDVAAFPNGHIPAAALCPLATAPGHALRADAAASFDALSRAYAAEFGTPICVTDSYRSYEAQVTVRAAKPTLAAVPGTSNHGWAVAVDLCGGVEHFGTPQHQWMRTHAIAHGWFHPSWAGPGGSKPEPWHWEFAG